MIYQKHTPSEEFSPQKAQYMMGDIVLCHDGSYGIIKDVSDEIPGWSPSYSLQRIRGYPLSKSAWWCAKDWKEVLLGPLHYILNEYPDGYGGTIPTNRPISLKGD